jgi:hypothetical protein
MRRFWLGAGAFGVFAATLGVINACSLDLDESLIARGKDAGPKIDANLPDGTIISESGVPIIPDAGACSADTDCPTSNACLKGRCDQVRRACAYDVCHPAACGSGVCNDATKTCSASVPYQEKVSTFAVDQQITFGLVAAYPWIFAGTTEGIVVYNVANPTNNKPAVVPLVGLGFNAVTMTRSGNRVWFGGAPAGTGPSKLPLAYIDVPADPFTPKLVATTVLTQYSRAASESGGLAGIGNKSTLIISQAPAFATGLIEPSVADGDSITGTPITPPAVGMTPGAVSGSRLILHGVTGSVATFSLVNNAGGTAPVNGPVVTITDTGEVSADRLFQWTLSGSVAWVTGVHAQNPLAPPNPPNLLTRASRAYFLTTDANSALSDVAGVDVETYDLATPGGAPGANAAVSRAGAMLDNDTLIYIAAAAEAPGTSSAINVVKRGSPPTVDKSKRVVLATPVTSFVFGTASDGFYYFSTNTSNGDPKAPVTTSSITVVEPGCGGK